MKTYTCIFCQRQFPITWNGKPRQRCPDCTRQPDTRHIKAMRCSLCGRNWPVALMGTGHSWRQCRDCIAAKALAYSRSPKGREARQRYQEQWPVKQRRKRYSHTRREYNRRYYQDNRERIREKQNARARRKYAAAKRAKVAALANGLKRHYVDCKVGYFQEITDDE